MKLILKRLLIIANFSVLGFLFENEVYAKFGSVDMEPGWLQDDLMKWSSKEMGIKINVG